LRGTDGCLGVLLWKVLSLRFEEIACRPGPLRAVRSLRDSCTLLALLARLFSVQKEHVYFFA
jgi:hypothetical protein